MDNTRPLTILCVSSYEKGQEFLRTCKSIGCRVLLLTVEKLRDGDWPRESLDELFFMPEDIAQHHLIYTVSYMNRSQPIDRILVLEFVPVLNYDAIREFMDRVPSPWLLKPRSQASGIGMKKIHKSDDLWPWLDQLGDQQSFYLLEQFVPGTVYHVDSIVSEREVLFAEPHVYGSPPLDVSHQGGVFTTRTLPRDTAETKSLLEVNRSVIEGLGYLRGVTHAEFLKSHADGKFYFKNSARVTPRR